MSDDFLPPLDWHRCEHGHRIGLPWVTCMVCKPRPDLIGVVLVEDEGPGAGCEYNWPG